MSKLDLTGKTYGELTVLYEDERKNGKRYWVAKCSCGIQKSIRQQSLTSGNTTSCGHRTNVIGLVSGMLVVIDDGANDINGSRRVVVACECGIIKNMRLSTFKHKHTKSCGCLRDEMLANGLGTTHGMSDCRLYACWHSMIHRSKVRDGCGVHDAFSTFERFAEWSLANGYSDDMVLCRNGDAGDYSPNNCRWDTHQSNDAEAHGKWWVVTNPEGEQRTIFNLAEFCRDNNLNEKGMSRVGRGERPCYKGWMCKLVEGDES